MQDGNNYSRMRIAILTLPLHTNYGGILQAWALQTVLERLGHKVVVLGLKKTISSWFKIPLKIVKRCLWRAYGRTTCPIFAEFIQMRHDFKYNNKVYQFSKKYIHLHNITGLDGIQPDKYDAMVVGSDQIWRKTFIKYLWGTTDYKTAFLGSIHSDGIKRIAYAASLGVSNWEYSDIETIGIRESLRKFSAISVREKSAVLLLECKTGLKATHVLDPTLLIPEEHYIELIPEPVATRGGGIVSYILDPNEKTDSLIKEMIQARGLNHSELNLNSLGLPLLSIEDWIKGFASADIVVTDSFHGCAFSIIFNKPLIFMRNEGRGNTRFDSLIDLFGIHDNEVSDNIPLDINKNYHLPQNISEKLNDLRKKSMEFINHSLSES